MPYCHVMCVSALKYVLHVDFVSCVCFMCMVLIVFFVVRRKRATKRGVLSLEQ